MNTTAEFLSNYTETVASFHAAQKAPANDVALDILLNKYKETLIKADLLAIPDNGFTFHKSFRNVAISDPEISMAIWFLLQDSPLFRGVLKEGRTLKPQEKHDRDYYRNLF